MEEEIYVVKGKKNTHTIYYACNRAEDFVVCGLFFCSPFFCVCVFCSFSNLTGAWEKDGVVYYFVKEGAKNPKGLLELGPDDSAHAVSNSDKSAYMFGINTPKRTFLMYPETQEEQERWLTAVGNAVSQLRGSAKRPLSRSSGSAGSSELQPRSPVVRRVRAEMKQRSLSLSNPDMVFEARDRLLFVRDKMIWKTEDAEKVGVKFWELWLSHFPQSVKEIDREEDAQIVREGGSEIRRSCITLQWLVALSRSKGYSYWEGTAGKESMLQYVVDFLWAGGAQDAHTFSEVGTLLQPATVSLWLELTSAGCVEAGYAFRAEEGLGEKLVFHLKAPTLTAWFMANKHHAGLKKLWRECSGRKTRCWRLLWSMPYIDVESSILSLSLPPVDAEMASALSQAAANDHKPADVLKMWVSVDDGTIVCVEVRIPLALATPNFALADVEKVAGLRASHATYRLVNVALDDGLNGANLTGLEWANVSSWQETFFEQ